MITTPPAVACATSLTDALVEQGVRDFVLSPGSRSAPLALALADREVRGLVRLHVRMDERSAGFFALGLARASNSPVALVCTSGSAVANLHPAVVEADYSAVPLLLLTADRPTELRGVGASQTIRQAEIFGESVRWFVDVGAPETGDATELARWSDLAAQAADRACVRRGPIHLNLAFRPPLVGEVPAPRLGLRTVSDPCSAVGDSGDAPGAPPEQNVGERETLNQDPTDLEAGGRNWLSSGDATRGILVVGDLPLPPQGSTDLSRGVLELAEQLGWPVIAEPTANMAPHPNLLSHGSLIAGCAEFVADHRPGLVVSVGRFGLSRAVTSFVASAEQHWALAADARGEPADPGLSADRLLTALPGIRGIGDPSLGTDHVVDSLSVSNKDESRGVSLSTDGALSGPSVVEAKTSDSTWLTDWRDADRAVGRVVRQRIPGGLCGAGAALAVWESLLPEETVFLASSWPIRFIDSFAGGRNAARALANRGANGIDGLVSTTLGIATAVGSRERPPETHAASDSIGTVVPVERVVGPGLRIENDSGPEPGEADGWSEGVVAILGDVAFLHDIGGLVGAGELAVDAILVVLNNDGGGIFSQLEQAAPEHERDFERVFGTPHGQDLAAIAKSMGVAACDVHDLPELQDALEHARESGGVHVIVARTLDRSDEAELLREVSAAACTATRVTRDIDQ